MRSFGFKIVDEYRSETLPSSLLGEHFSPTHPLYTKYVGATCHKKKIGVPRRDNLNLSTTPWLFLAAQIVKPLCWKVSDVIQRIISFECIIYSVFVVDITN